MNAEILPVLCCCEPENLLGHAPAGLPIPMREFEEVDGATGQVVAEGVAYAAHDIDLPSVGGFVPLEAAKKGGGKKGGRKGGGKKGTKRTWR